MMRRTYSKHCLRFLSILLLGILASCARAPVEPLPPAPTPVQTKKQQPRKDTYHTVGPGETFWRIAKMYDVPIATIMKANRMQDSQDLKMGQRLLIPQAAELQPVVALFPSDKWRYIIIHHSATEAGNSLAFHQAHLKKGWDQGVGYHFVIDNATSGKIDGQIEVSPRWIKQLDGAHCKAGDMNVKAIGICLVGNFNDDRVSDKQMESLVYLVKTMQDYYKIPDDHIMGHRHVEGSATDCPGGMFPWDKFWRKLRSK